MRCPPPPPAWTTSRTSARPPTTSRTDTSCRRLRSNRPSSRWVTVRRPLPTTECPAKRTCWRPEVSGDPNTFILCLFFFSPAQSALFYARFVRVSEQAGPSDHNVWKRIIMIGRWSKWNTHTYSSIIIVVYSVYCAHCKPRCVTRASSWCCSVQSRGAVFHYSMPARPDFRLGRRQRRRRSPRVPATRIRRLYLIIVGQTKPPRRRRLFFSLVL